nr:SMR family transporter [Methanosarcina horonobensis]
MKLSEGFSKLIPSVLIFVFYAISFFFFTLALKGIDVSIAYAVWAGLGTAL